MDFGYTKDKKREEEEKKILDILNTEKSYFANPSASKPTTTASPSYQPTQWDKKTNYEPVQKALDAISERKPFSYDINADALYQQYKNQYMLNGQNAMNDAMGRAQAMTGGYGNSYAQSVGQQAYGQYMQGLNDTVPELYQLALSRYNAEGDDLMNKYALAKDKYDTDYAEFMSDRDYNQDIMNAVTAYEDAKKIPADIENAARDKKYSELEAYIDELVAEEELTEDQAVSLADKYLIGNRTASSFEWQGSNKFYDKYTKKTYTRAEFIAELMKAGYSRAKANAFANQIKYQ